jgi:Flp pilus assembly protein TadB
VLTVLLALLVVVLAVAPFLLAWWLTVRTRRRTGFDDELARLVDDTRWPGPSR